MSVIREKTKSSTQPSGQTTADLIQRVVVSDEARRAALNLLEDAVEARAQAERAMAELQQSQARNAFLLRLSDAVRPVGDAVEVQRIASTFIGEQLAASRVFYAESDGEKALVHDDYTEGVESFAGSYRLSDFGSHWMTELGAGRIVAVRDVSSDPRISDDIRASMLRRQVRAWLAVPLVKDDELVGAFVLHQSTSRDWKPDEVSLVEEVAQRTWASVSRARAETRTQEVERRYRTLFESIDQGFCTLEVRFDQAGKAVDYRFLEVSPSFERQTGIVDAQGRWMREIAPDQDEVWFEIYGRVAKTGMPVRFEEGSTPLQRWWSVYAFRVDDPSDNHVAVLFVDITERRRSEAALRESQERLQTAQQAGNIGVWDWDATAGQTYWSQTMWELYGYERPQPEPERIWIQHLHPEDSEAARKKVKDLLASTETDHRDEFRIIRVDEAVRWIEVVARVERDANGRPLRMAGVNVDITHRKRAEGALRTSEERLRLLTESFHDISIFTTDVEGKVVTWNPGAEKIFGYKEAEIIGLNGRILFVPEDQDAGEPEHEMDMARSVGRAADERWHLRKDGSRFYASGMMAPLYEGHTLIGYAKIARDLTSAKEAEEELRRQYDELESIVSGRTSELAEANEALRQEMEQRRLIEEERFALLQKIVTTQEDERRRIARDMHDSLGQQLTALRLKLASMKTELDDPRMVSESLEQLQEFGKRLDSEVNFLVWELRPTVLDDLGLVAAIENFAHEWSRHYGIPIEVHTGKFLKERLSADVETNLYRILQEALNNAHKHSGARAVNVVLESRKREIVLIVEDDGIGFDPDRVGIDRDSGRGFGLIGMRERAAIVGGKVEIESSPGQGTTIYVRAAPAATVHK